ncbi:MAG TPA: ParB/RepB/Spo0J family partition protein [Magnetospirillaceae bacterium]
MSPADGPKKPLRGLGRGLSALMGDVSAPPVPTTPPASSPAAASAAPAPAPNSADAARGLRQLPTISLKPGKFQPRRHFDEAAIKGLAESLKNQGMLQPILVRKLGASETYEIIAGERRWRAAQAAGLHEVPVLVRTLTDAEALEIALVENLQREDLNAIEEAEAYRRLMDEFGHTQEALAQHLGKSRSHVANTLRLLVLPDEVKAMLEQGKLSPGHARALLVANDPLALAHEIIAKNLSVRETEDLVKRESTPNKAQRAGKKTVRKIADADVRALEHDLATSLGLEVELKVKGQGGELRLRYATLDQLDGLLTKLGQGKR